MQKLIHQTLADELANRSIAANAAQFGIAGLVALLLSGEHPPGIYGWTASIAILAAFRIVWLRYNPRPFPLKLMPATRGMAAAAGLLWAACIGLGMVSVSLNAGVLLACLAVGLIAGACQTLYVDPPSLVFYVGPIAVATVGALVWVGSRVTLVAAVMIAIYTLYLAMNTRARYRSTRDLIESREIAVRSIEARRLFLANMSHEIRTPLNGIVGMTELMLGSNLDAEQLEYTVTTRTCAESLVSVIDDVLDYSRIEAGKMQLRHEPFSLSEAIEQAVDILAQRAREKQIVFSCYIDPDLPTALIGDASRLRQILLNLANNAIKFTEEGSVTINVGGQTTGDASLRLEVEIRDTGIGIDAESVPGLFQAFSQVDPSDSRRHGGSGLGLALSKRLVEEMAGEIGVESELGKGSSFRFSARLDRQRSEDNLQTLLPDSLRGQRVLLIDPADSGRKIFARQLRAVGLVVVDRKQMEQTRSVLETAARQAPFQLLIVVDRGESADGRRIIEEIGESLHALQVKALLVGKLGFRGDCERSRRLGFVNYLSLPVKPSWLLSAVHATLLERPFVPGLGKERRPVVRPSSPAAHIRGRILLAEDNPVNRKVAVHMLERLGYQVLTATNGVEALEVLAEDSVDLLLTDVQMPEMDGLELTRELRRREQGCGPLPIVAMTAHAFQEDQLRCMEAGMNGYLRKPVDSTELDQTIGRLLREGREAGALALCEGDICE